MWSPSAGRPLQTAVHRRDSSLSHSVLVLLTCSPSPSVFGLRPIVIRIRVVLGCEVGYLNHGRLNVLTLRSVQRGIARRRRTVNGVPAKPPGSGGRRKNSSRLTGSRRLVLVVF